MLNIKFSELSYEIKSGVLARTKKHILKNISGEFRNHELSAIVGPSGSGKSTLMDVLSGFITKNINGSITINESSNRSEFRKRSAYIMQEQKFNSALTVYEAMKFSMQLKTGNAFNVRQQRDRIKAILTNLGLETHLQTFIENLSGGQQKRLSIALELVDDALILFLDEPTSGLDASSSSKCIELLKKLALEGRTIICTIHTPSALLFHKFDQIYALAEGCCIYKGSSVNVVPFLRDLDLICPESYNPADFLLEIANNDYGLQNHRLVEKILNGSSTTYIKVTETIATSSTESSVLPAISSSTFLQQFQQLLKRNYIESTRNPTLIIIRLLVHFFTGICVAALYWDIGNKAEQIINNFKLLFFLVSFISYASFYSILVSFPLNVSNIRRECFNRWYSPSAYYLALTISDIPITILSNVIFISVTYFMTNQPEDLVRIAMFSSIVMLTSFTAQGLGIMAGSVFNLQGSLIFAAMIIVFHAVFAGVYILAKDANELFGFLFEISFLKYSTFGIVLSVLGYGRGKLDCNSIYCHFQSPEIFLETIGFSGNFNEIIRMLVMFFVLFRIAAFMLMSYRIKNK